MSKADDQFSILYQRIAWNESLVNDIHAARDKKEPYDLKKLKQIRENLNDAKRAERELRKALKIHENKNH
jgi:hypothetical protein